MIVKNKTFFRAKMEDSMALQKLDRIFKVCLLMVLSVFQCSNAALSDYLTLDNVTSFGKDALVAYGLAMGLTAFHEFGHAITAKIFWGSPIDMTLGCQPGGRSFSLPIFPGVRLGGLNPATGYAYTSMPLDARPVERMIMSAAGPVFGALGSAAVLYYLHKKYPGYGKKTLSKLVGLYGFLNHIRLMVPVGIPNNDADRAYEAFRDWQAERVS